MKKIVFATNNNHKLSEIRAMLPDDIEILSLAEIGCHEDIPETADTLEGNAEQKARFIYDRYGYDCFADDTGLPWAELQVFIQRVMQEKTIIRRLIQINCCMN